MPNEISSVEIECFELVADHRYKIAAYRLPSSFNHCPDLHEDIDCRDIAVPKERGVLWCHVHYEGQNPPVARGIFGAGSNSIQCDEVHVNNGHRRRGIATALYQLANIIFDDIVVKSPVVIDDGPLFWGTDKVKDFRSLHLLTNPLLVR